MESDFLKKIEKSGIDEDKTALEILGFRDITELLLKGELDDIRENDLIRRVYINKGRIENHNGKMEKVYEFSLDEYNLSGRVFPLDEIIKINEYYDIVVKNLKGYRTITLDSQVYHDLHKGEVLKVQISRRKPGFDPSFKIFNHITGFVKDARNGLYEKLQEGSAVSVEIFDLNENKKGLFIVVWPLKILEDEKY